jgi:hypothetical protein
MKKKSWKILYGIVLLYLTINLGFGIFKKYNPTFYQESFNDERIEIGLVPIDSTLIRKGENTWVYQSWTNESTEIPRFYGKYASFHKWNHGIKMENDNYVVMVDTSKVILSINYNFDTEKFNYTLEEYDKSQNSYELYGHSGKTIRVLNRTETKEILNNNGIKY